MTYSVATRIGMFAINWLSFCESSLIGIGDMESKRTASSSAYTCALLCSFSRSSWLSLSGRVLFLFTFSNTLCWPCPLSLSNAFRFVLSVFSRLRLRCNDKFFVSSCPWKPALLAKQPARVRENSFETSTKNGLIKNLEFHHAPTPTLYRVYELKR